MDPSDNNMNGHGTGSPSLVLKGKKKSPTILFRFAKLPEITSPAGLSNQNLPPAGSSNLNLPSAGPSNQNLFPPGPSNQNLPPNPYKWKAFADGLNTKEDVPSPSFSIQMGPAKFPLLVKLREEFEEKSQDEDTKTTSWLLLDKPTPDKN